MADKTKGTGVDINFDALIEALRARGIELAEDTTAANFKANLVAALLMPSGRQPAYSNPTVAPDMGGGLSMSTYPLFGERRDDLVRRLRGHIQSTVAN